MTRIDRAPSYSPLETQQQVPRESSRWMRELWSKAVRASAWTVGGMAASRVLRLASNLVMTRLLFPEAFGLMALVNIYLQGMQMMSDLGIGPSIIQSKRGDEPGLLNTAWSLQIIRGIVIWLVLATLAWPLAAFYGEPRLGWLLAVAGLSAVIAGFESTAQHTLNRHLELKTLTFLEVGSQLVAIGGIIAWALVHRSVWALVGGTLLGAIARTAWSHRLLPGAGNRLLWNPQAAREVIRFGKWIFLGSAIGFLASQVDRMMLPKLIPFDFVGIYSIAVLLASIPDQLVATLGYRVMFPSMSRLVELSHDDLLRTVTRVRGVLLPFLAVAAALLAGLGDLLVRVLYDTRYHEAGWILCILATGLWPRLLANTMGPVLLGIGQPRYLAYSGALRAALIVIGMPVAHSLYGLPGIVVVVAAANVADYVVEAFGLWRHGLWIPRQDLTASALWLAVLILLSLACPGNPWSHVL